MSSRNHASKLNDHRKRDKRTYLLQSLLFGALTVTGVLYVVAVYWGISSAERKNAGKEFKALAAQVGMDIRKTFAQSDQALNYLAERYATIFPNEAEWPLVQLPGFVKDMPYLSDASGFESLLFVPIVKWEAVNRTETFLMDAWAANPLIPVNAGLLPLPGIFGLNESAGTVPYKDTTKVVWDAQYEVRAHTQSPFAPPRDLVMQTYTIISPTHPHTHHNNALVQVVLPIAQMLMNNGLPNYFLGCDLHASINVGPFMENIMRCTMGSNYSYARKNWGRASELDFDSSGTEPAVFTNVGVPIMLNQNSNQLVGFVGGHFQWETFISALIPEQYSGNYLPP
jgi:hypothetical protein